MTCTHGGRRVRWTVVIGIVLAMSVIYPEPSSAVDCPDCWVPNPDYDPNDPYPSEEPCQPVPPDYQKSCGEWQEHRVNIETTTDEDCPPKWDLADSECSGDSDPRSHPSITLFLEKECTVTTTTKDHVWETRKCDYTDPCYPDYFGFETSGPPVEETNVDVSTITKSKEERLTPYNFSDPGDWFQAWAQYCT